MGTYSERLLTPCSETTCILSGRLCGEMAIMEAHGVGGSDKRAGD